MKFLGERMSNLQQTTSQRIQKPPWLKVPLPGGESFAHLKQILRAHNLHTVCEEARCPNIGECWSGGTATFMLMGDICTRGCRFCAVKSGNPRGASDPDEPKKVADLIAEMGLDYVVLTSVDRDDLPDQGSVHYAESVKQIKLRSPHIWVETLIPDFRADRQAIARIVDSGADVIAHNLETVERLTPRVRDRRATYPQSLNVLALVKELDPRRITKSSLMLGVGEERSEIEKSMDDLRTVGVEILTLGQYLQPTHAHLPVTQFVSPGEFHDLAEVGRGKGFLYVASGPLVRSSYRAGEYFTKHVLEERANF